MSKRIRLSKISNKMNQIGAEIDIAKSIALILEDLELGGGCNNIKHRDIASLAIIMLREIKYIHEKYESLLRQLNI